MVNFYRAHIDGTLFDGQERFSTSFALESVDGQDVLPSAMGDWCDDVMTLLGSADLGASSLRAMISSRGTIERVRLYYYPDSGAPALFAASSVVPAIDGQSTAAFPPQCSLAISLLTQVAGKRFRGRMYWPHIGGALTTAGKSTLATQSLTTNIATTLATINALAQIDIGVIGVHSAASDLVTPVTRVSIGDVIDTQRRRRDDMVEVRTVGFI